MFSRKEEVSPADQQTKRNTTNGFSNGTDTHCHLSFPDYRDDLEAVVARAAEAGIGVINIGTDLVMSERAVALANRFPDMWAAVGVHPHHAPDVPAALARLREIAADPKVVAIGEIGLDYYRLADQDVEAVKRVQREAFAGQLELASELKLPVIIHSREAGTDILDVLRVHGTGLAGVAHSFSGTIDEARAFLELGFYIGFTGVITFKNAEALRDVVRFVPLDRLLVETDAPFLAPEPNRGKRNEPAWVEFVVKKVAEVKNEPIGRVAEMTTENARTLFKVE
ncbi:TatD family hydrolase [Candidatus Parcubacteria bacterium]|nr:TatD family hydrolase [Candidatus Parcubacteria bacterium]